MSNGMYTPRYCFIQDLASLATHLEDTPMASGDRGVFALAVRNDNAATVVTDANGDYSQVSVDDRGQVFVRFGPSSGGPVFAEDSAHVSGDLGFFQLAVRRDTPTSGVNADGDYASFNVDADGYLYVRTKAYDPPTNAQRVLPVWSIVDRRTPGDAAVQIATAQVLSATLWAAGTGDLGPEIATAGYTFICVWLNVTINNSQNVRIRALGKHTSAGTDEYMFPLKAVDAAMTPFNVKVEGDYAELNIDADQKVMLIYPLYNCVPYVQFQAMVEVAGASPATVTAHVTYGFGGAS